MMKKIMSVDDEENVCRSVKILLENAGYNVVTALSGKEALTRLKEEDVDLVLLDFFLGDMTGREVAEEIRKNQELENLKLAFLTVAKFGKNSFNEMKRLKISDYIRKPFDNQDLINRVRKVLNT